MGHLAPETSPPSMPRCRPPGAGGSGAGTSPTAAPPAPRGLKEPALFRWAQCGARRMRRCPPSPSCCWSSGRENHPQKTPENLWLPLRKPLLLLRVWLGGGRGMGNEPGKPSNRVGVPCSGIPRLLRFAGNADKLKPSVSFGFRYSGISFRFIPHTRNGHSLPFLHQQVVA